MISNERQSLYFEEASWNAAGMDEDDAMQECMICHQLVRAQLLNAHVNDCLDREQGIVPAPVQDDDPAAPAALRVASELPRVRSANDISGCTSDMQLAREPACVSAFFF